MMDVEIINVEYHYWKYMLKVKKYVEGNNRRKGYAAGKMTWTIY